MVELESRDVSGDPGDTAVNAGNAALTPANVHLAINKVRKALGINHLSKLIAYMAVEQEHAWENLGITVSQIIKEGGSGSSNDLDLLFTGRKTMSGIDQVQRECGSDPRGFLICRIGAARS